MKKQSGFTLIELVIVIIILGILAVTAAPKFLNLQDDAKKAAANGVLAAVQSSAQLVYSRAVLDGKEKDETGNATVSGAGSTAIKIFAGYPKASKDGIEAAINLDGGWSGDVVAGSTTSYQFVQSANKKKDAECVLYTQGSSAAAATSKVSKLDADNGKCAP
ncbi:prepilin-type N-terminal cleavage/methylation domain-containing protein [Aeromonas schubertii]|uniref:prepilin-type N-terminal cleavage/methylation domain-containing protein n=1 Tax=Aeromonas schubertii TaxID=652 RepID=UPI0010A9142B|nr:prepilin-type N-terminal cleavage/methylation domain-containing protein [Aeromonas schubertii]QCG49358.1 prepilin-type N-terminal cleavage/methylation domain-containing protein [Aeromonas schubertii]